MSGMRSLFGGGMDQDWVDSVNGFWSVLLLAVCSGGAFLARYVTQPIRCWTPAEFTSGYNDYTRQTCFKRDTYVTSFGMDDDIRQGMVSSYHLWIPLILFFQALCFKIPNIIWNFGKHYLTLNMDNTVDTLKQSLTTSPDTRRTMFQDAARVLAKLLEGNKFFLAVFYLFVKLLTFLNLIGQLAFLSIYFKNSLAITTRDFNNNRLNDLTEPLLLKNVLCVLKILRRQNVQTWSVQCELLISEIYEKMFVFLWFWVLLLAVVTFFNLLLWAGFLFIPFLRDRRIIAYIKASPESSQDSSVITRFISGFLGMDGVLVLSMISRNSSEMVAADLSQQLYQMFLGHACRPVPSTSAREITEAPPGIEGIPMENLTTRGVYDEKTSVP